MRQSGNPSASFALSAAPTADLGTVADLPAVRVPGMIMIGAAGRNAGKTEFSCSLIKNRLLDSPVVGLKVTTVCDRDAECPRGENRCGACTSFLGGFSLAEESGKRPEKDTARMLAAGASRSFWLRVHKDSLQEGLNAFLAQLNPGEIVVCESNSLRLAADPDLFIVVREKGSEGIKPSCTEVLHLSDGLVESDGRSFSIPPERFSMIDGHWSFGRDAAAVVLAGGRSSRMGTNKAMLPVSGEPMIRHIVERLAPSFSKVLVSSSGREDYSFLGLPIVRDLVPGQGPLMALASVLEASPCELNLVVPCDTPCPPRHLITRLLRSAAGADVVVPVNADGEREPLFAVYRKSILPAVKRAIARGERRVVSFFHEVRVSEISIDADTIRHNLNTPLEFREFCSSMTNR